MVLQALTSISVLVLLYLGQASSLEMITRDEWFARRPTIAPIPLKLPVSRVIIAHTATKECHDTEFCVATLRNLQDYHIDARGLGDISFNFLIGGDGIIYIGRGWNKQGSHTKGHNQDSICIAFIGNFEEKEPTRPQIQNAQLLLEQGIQQNYLTPDYKLYGHRQLIATASPGTAFYRIIKNWPHWSPI